MSEIFKNRRLISLILAALFVVTTVATGFVASKKGLIAKPEQESSSLAEEESEDPTEEEEPPIEEEEEPVFYNIPAEMRGVYLVPGTDFIKTADTSEATIRQEIDAALAAAQKLSMNTVIIDTVYNDSVIYHTKDSLSVSDDFDIMEYLVAKSREMSFYTYAIFDATGYSAASGVVNVSSGVKNLDKLEANVAEFAQVYEPDAILIDGYYNEKNDGSYPTYLMVGGSIGFDNFMRQSPLSVVKTISNTIRTKAKGVQVGLLTDSVWENSEANELGSNTTATFTALGNGNADTLGFLQQGLVDFVAVKAFSSTASTSVPFKEVVSWWSSAAEEEGLPLYLVHASSKACTEETGWAPHDQLAKQVIEASAFSGFRGSIFNNLQRLVEDPKGATTTLIKLFNDEVNPEHILTELQITKPDKQTFTTYEPSITFTGASDPNSPVTINGTTVPTDASGYFTISFDLKGGVNTYSIVHKEKTLTYNITRQVQILKSIDPVGSITTDGSMDITLSAMAYTDAEVYAKVGGVTVPMEIVDDSVSDVQDRDSNYKLFTGTYTAPSATTSVQNVGTITIYASWNGENESMQGASIKVNKRAKIEDGVPVVVIADQAKTYPPNTLNNIPTSNYYPLPKGAMDYAIGDEVVYKKGNETFTYFVLASGMRVESKDIQASSGDYAGDNVISGMKVVSEGGFTNVTLKTAQKVSYSFKYEADRVEITFHNTTKGTSGSKLSSTPLFSEVSWNGATLILKLQKSGGFMGYKGYYDSEGNLVLRFNNPPSSIKNARITIDPGHGGSDTGALGFLAKYPEKVINASIAAYLEEELTSRGATVLLLDTSSRMELTTRVAKAEAFNSDLFISVHNNSAPNASAAGTEIYYFYPYSRTLATNASKNVSSQLSTTNRGAKYSYYHVTLSSQFPSILAECGFMSNKNEYEKIISSKYQQNIAVGLADAASAAIKAAYSGSTASGSDSMGSGITEGEENSSSQGSGSASVESVSLNTSTLSLKAGDTRTLRATVSPDDAENTDVIWKSSSSSVAKVDSSGKVTAVKNGTATITVTTKDGGKTATCKVTVSSSASSTKDEVEDLAFEDGDFDIPVGESLTLAVSIYPDSAQSANLTFKSSKSSVASVTDAGKLTALREGTTTITVTAESGASDTCEVTVYNDGSSSSSSGSDSDDLVEVSKTTDIGFDSSSLSLYRGQTLEMLVDSDLGYVNNRGITWSSSKTSIATVDSRGRVTAKTAGSTEIVGRGKNKDGSFVLRCTVRVTTDRVVVTGVSLDKTSLSLVKDQTAQLKATVAPTNASIRDVTWKSSNKKIASVDSSGKITAVNRGTATITVSTKDGNKSATCTVEVTRDQVYIDDVIMEYPEIEIPVGDETELYAEVYPENATDKTLEWKSSNTKVATVDSKGVIKARAKGTATITATAKDSNGKIYDVCRVTVYE